MNKYSYKAKDKKGKTIKGLVEAKNERAVIILLKERDLMTTSLSLVRDSELKIGLVRFLQKITVSDLATFTRQLSTMITAGLALPESIAILKNQAKPAFGLVLDDIIRAIEEGGVTFAKALKKYENVFGKVYIALVTAGEAAGVLDEVLERLANDLEKQKEFRSKIKGAMVYPIIIVIGMLLVGVIVMVFVLPQVLTLFSEFDTQLPLPTKILIGFSNFMTNFWWVGIIMILSLIFVWRRIQKSVVGKKKIDSFKLKLPIFGNLQKQVILTEMVRTLALLVKTGIPLVEALKIIAKGIDNLVFQDGLLVSANRVEKGSSLAEALGEHESFPIILTQMISVGEETGKLDEVLFKVSSYFESESERAVKNLTTAIEPLIMVVLGVGVGFLVIAVIMPMYSLTSQF